jgi:RiboL-PSP-HEPN
MTSDDFVAELYRGYDWHFDEVRRLKNLFADIDDESLQSEYRKSLVLVLYAHFEGFCVFSLQHYLAAINRAGINCDKAVSAILAGSWEPMFNAMEHGDQKCRIFSRTLPNDPSLHRHWRRRHFVEEMDRLLARPVNIPENTIDAKSNLNANVLQRNLFLLGLDHHFVDPHTETIHNLLGRRNRIAHGDDRRGVSSLEYDGFDSAVFVICCQLIDMLADAFGKTRFQKT